MDRAPDGGLRIIDYKTGGPAAFTVKAVIESKKLQLPLYALAAAQALGLGPVVDGFYRHAQQAEASKFTLAGCQPAAGFAGGPVRPPSARRRLPRLLPGRRLLLALPGALVRRDC